MAEKSEVRDKVVTVRVSLREKEILEKGARQEQRTVADYIRTLALRDVIEKMK